jgi:hypothetical protein
MLKPLTRQRLVDASSPAAPALFWPAVKAESLEPWTKELQYFLRPWLELTAPPPAWSTSTVVGAALTSSLILDPRQ